ncbi:MAG: phospholipase D-like domain-containing protein [bacterium]
MEYFSFFQRIKKHRIRIFIWIILILIVVFLSFKTTWNKPPLASIARTEIPSVSASSGTLALMIEPDQGIQPVLSLIQNAATSVDLVMYQLSDKNISDALIDATHRGITVRVLLNEGYFGKQEGVGNSIAYQYLQNAGVPIHWTPKAFALTHQKTLIIDGNQALIMTWNFVPKYYATGRDFGILDKNKNDVDAIEKTFTADWNNTQITPPLGDDLVWSPGAQNDMLLIIHNAKTSLDIYNEEINSEDVITALEDASKRGVSVRLLMTYATANKRIYTELQNSGVVVHTFAASTKKLYIHAKMILADKSQAFVGSQNFSFTSLNKNRELGIFVTDSNILSSLENTFTTDWQNARNFAIKK